MKIKEITARKSDRDATLKGVASHIRPLPENVVPSTVFLDQMRSRLLKLPGSTAADRRAA